MVGGSRKVRVSPVAYINTRQLIRSWGTTNSCRLPRPAPRSRGSSSSSRLERSSQGRRWCPSAGHAWPIYCGGAPKERDSAASSGRPREGKTTCRNPRRSSRQPRRPRTLTRYAGRRPLDSTPGCAGPGRRPPSSSTGAPTVAGSPGAGGNGFASLRRPGASRGPRHRGGRGGLSGILFRLDFHLKLTTTPACVDGRRGWKGKSGRRLITVVKWSGRSPPVS